MEEPLSDLILAAAEGNSDAASEIVRRYGERVRAAVRRRLPASLRSRADSEDILQTAMVSALARLSSLEYRGEKAFFSWLVAVAEQETGLLSRHHRAMKRDLARDCQLKQAEFVPDDRTTASQAAVRKERKVSIQGALSTLPDTEQQVVLCRSWEGLSFKEVAETVGLPDAEAARTVYRRALRELGVRLMGRD